MKPPGCIVRRLSCLCFSLGALVLICGCIFAWVMRDGLGPESHTSEGSAALSRFLTWYTPIAFIGLLLVLFSVLTRFRAWPVLVLVIVSVLLTLCCVLVGRGNF
jgi:uncharacterized membrane protein